ncbi:putative methionyl-tRNA synthetase [Hordeum vulgare]|nr:putative methionyl-tRNA synthetase [Hordeum vulgare]
MGEGRADGGGTGTSAEEEEGEKKRVSNAKPAEPRIKWTSKEDECLAEAWRTVNIDPITDANQNTNTYWGRIKRVFDERKLVDPDFANIHLDRGDKAMANHWTTIQTTCNKWHGIVEEMVRMFGMYRQDNNDQEFKFLHVFSRIESCEKWREVRLALAKSKETYNPDASAPDCGRRAPR